MALHVSRASATAAPVTLRSYGTLVVAALTPIGDLAPTQKVFGSIGGRPSLLAAPIMVYLFRHEIRSVAGATLAPLATGWLYGLVISLVSLFFLPAAARGAPLTVKTATLSVILGLWILTIVWVAAAAVAERPSLAAGLGISYAGSLIFLVFEVFRPGNFAVAWHFVHSSINVQERPRILSTESSTAGASLVAAALGWAAAARPRTFIFVIVLGTVSWGVALVESRGTVVSLILAAALTAGTTVGSRLYRRDGRLERAATVAALLTTVASLLLFNNLSNFSNPAAGTSQSDATRSAWAIAANTSIVEHPEGSGYARPQVDASRWLTSAYTSLVDVYPARAFHELERLAGSQSGVALAPKTLLSTLEMYWGIPGLVVVLLLLRRIWLAVLRSSIARDLRTVLAASFVIPACMIYVSSIYEPALAMLLGIAVAAASAGAGTQAKAGAE